MDNKESKHGRLASLPDNEKLRYDGKKSVSNVVDFELNLLTYARINFDDKANQILCKKEIPRDWIEPFEYPPDNIDYTQLEIARMTAQEKKRDIMIEDWKRTLPKFVSFLELSLHPTGLARIHSLSSFMNN